MFSVAAFREAFPAFADPDLYPSPVIEAAHANAECYLSASARWYRCEQCRDQIEMLITAHLLYLHGSPDVPGQTATGIITSATVGSVSVSYAVTTASKSSYSSWLLKSPYGEELLALLSRFAIGIGYIGGSPERRAFRKFGGMY